MITKEFIQQVELSGKAEEFAVTLVGMKVRKAGRKLALYMQELLRQSAYDERNELVPLARHISCNADWGFEKDDEVRFRVTQATSKPGIIMRIVDGQAVFTNAIVPLSLVSSADPEQMELFDN